METDELIQFLKENLTVRVKIDSDGDLNVILFLGEEEISKDWTNIPNSPL